MDIKQKHIAVVGVSEDKNKFGYKIFKDLLDSGYSVEGVNLKGGEILGKKIYETLSNIPKKPDIVLMVVPSEQTEIITDECINMKIPEIWMQPGSESQNAIERAKKAEIKVISNSCFMVQNKIW